MYRKELRRQVRQLGVRSLPWVFRCLPESWGRELCAGIGVCAHRWVARDRYLARSNLARVHPDWEQEKVQRVARKVFAEIGRNSFDFLRYPNLKPARQEALVVLEGREHLDQAMNRGKGVLVVTGHLGCWELLGAALVREGYPLKALARPLREARLDTLLTQHRRRLGVETFSSRVLPLQSVRHLKQGGLLGVLVDQRVKESGVEVRFMGQPTKMTDAPARLALATGAALVPMGVWRDEKQQHRVRITSPILPERHTVPDLTQRLAERMEFLIDHAPDQWIWIHPRWEDGKQGAGVPVSQDVKEGGLCASG